MAKNILNSNLSNLNFSLNQIKYFVTVADTLNFTKAGEILYVPQSSVSQQISQLEERIGVKLFHRDTRSVKLTSAGEIFYKETKKILAQTDLAISKTQKAQEGYLGTITIGFLAGPVMNLLPAFIRDFSSKYPDIEIILNHLTTEQINDQLISNEIDIGFSLQLGTKQNDNLIKTFLYTSQLCVYLSNNHPLADKAVIKLEDLADEVFILRDRKVVSHWYDYIINLCHQHKFNPKVIASPQRLEAVMIYVASEMGITLLPKYLEFYVSPSIKLVPLEYDGEKVEVFAFYNKTIQNPALKLFVDELKNKLTY